jgi:hypothetical protein
VSADVVSRSWTQKGKLRWVALIVAVLSLCLSSGAFYYFFRPRTVEKVVEKPIDRIVEKNVPIPCPEKPKDAEKHVGLKASPLKSPPSVTQTCTGSICNGGANSGTQTVNNFVPPQRQLTPQQVTALNSLADSLPDDAKSWFTVDSLNVPECIQYGDAIQKIFKQHDKTVADVVIWLAARPPLPKGIVVAVTSKTDEHFSYAQNIVNVLASNGFPNVSFSPMNGLPAGHIKIVIGEQ